MFKFSKVVVLFFMIIGLIGCSSVPSGVNKDFYNSHRDLILVIDECFNDTSNCKINEQLDKFDKVNEDYPEGELTSTELEIRNSTYAILFTYLGGDEVEYKRYFNEASELFNLNEKYE